MAKTYYTVPDKASGDTFTEAMWDNYIKTNINNLRVPPSVAAYIGSDMTLTVGVEDTLNLNGQDYDTDTMWTSPNDYVLINTPGVYVLSAQGELAAAVTWEIYILADPGVIVAYGQAISNVRASCHRVTILDSATKLYTYVKALTGSGSTLYAGASIQAQWIGATS